MKKIKLTSDQAYDLMQAGESRHNPGQAVYYMTLPNGEYREWSIEADEAWAVSDIDRILDELAAEGIVSDS